MSNSNGSSPNCHFTPRATLIGLGIRLERLGIMATIGHYVEIKQKTVRDSPLDKLTDALATILSGGKGLYEANKRVRTDPALQRAFGRERCAEQSVISETFDGLYGRDCGANEPSADRDLPATQSGLPA